MILVTGLDEVSARVEGPSGGADDYLVKPFAVSELAARVQAFLRRPAPVADRSYKAGNVAFCGRSRTLEVGGVPTPLSRREGMLLEQLLRRAGRVIAREMLDDALFGFDDDGSGNAIEAGISRLCKRLWGAGCTRCAAWATF